MPLFLILDICFFVFFLFFFVEGSSATAKLLIIFRNGDIRVYWSTKSFHWSTQKDFVRAAHRKKMCFTSIFIFQMHLETFSCVHIVSII